MLLGKEKRKRTELKKCIPEGNPLISYLVFNFVSFTQFTAAKTPRVYIKTDECLYNENKLTPYLTFPKNQLNFLNGFKTFISLFFITNLLEKT